APTPEARTAFVAPRIAVLAIAILAFGGGGPVLRDLAGGAHKGYLVMGAVTGLVIGVGMVISALLTTPQPVGTWSGAGRDLKEAVFNAPRVVRQGFRVIRSATYLPSLLGAFVLQALAAGTMLAAAPYLATYILHNESAASILFVALVGPALALMPLARRLADVIGKRRAFQTATLIFALGAGSLLGLFLHVGPWVYAAVACAGVGYAGMQLYPLAMLPDVIAADQHRTGHDRGGIISGMWTAGETAGMALGPTAALLVLAVTGFVSSTGATAAIQPDSALAGVIVIISALPAGLALLGLIPLRGYKLTH
ncbi:MAG TPA: MFS transporter, partial [Beutenbergiaceae bacterium]|nr:MFS transporter [Beutenbergiaceae bacterium]